MAVSIIVEHIEIQVSAQPCKLIEKKLLKVEENNHIVFFPKDWPEVYWHLEVLNSEIFLIDVTRPLNIKKT